MMKRVLTFAFPLMMVILSIVGWGKEGHDLEQADINIEIAISYLKDKMFSF